jgi:hypothetical protein
MCRKRGRLELMERKKKLYAQYRAVQREMQAAAVKVNNADHLLG